MQSNVSRQTLTDSGERLGKKSTWETREDNRKEGRSGSGKRGMTGHSHAQEVKQAANEELFGGVSCPTLTTMEIRGIPMPPPPPASGTSFSKNCPIFSWAFGSVKGSELTLTIFHLDPKMVSSTRCSRLHVNKVPRRIPFRRKDYCLRADFLNSGELLTITLNAHGFCFL